MAESNIKLKDLEGNEREYDNIKTIKIPKATQEQEGEVEYAVYIQPDLQRKTITPTAVGQTVKPNEGYDALEEVVIEAVPYSETDNDFGGRTVSICS